MAASTCRRVALTRRPRSNWTADLSGLATLYFVELELSADELGVVAPVRHRLTMASEIWPIPPRRAASRAKSTVEISTPMPPIMIGTNSCLPNFRR